MLIKSFRYLLLSSFITSSLLFADGEEKDPKLNADAVDAICTHKMADLGRDWLGSSEFVQDNPEVLQALNLNAPDANAVRELLPEVGIATPAALQNVDRSTLPTGTVARWQSAASPNSSRVPYASVDPADILFVEFYSEDVCYANIGASFPDSVEATLTAISNYNERRIIEVLKRRNKDLPTVALRLVRLTLDLSKKVDDIEAEHAPKIEALVRRMVADQFGSEVSEKIQFNRTHEIPAWPSLGGEEVRVIGGTSQVPQAPQRQSRLSLLQRLFGGTNEEAPEEGIGMEAAAPRDAWWEEQRAFFTARREFYNILAQASGWDGMAIMSERYGAELAQIHPDLPNLYRKLHQVMRLSNAMMSQLVPEIEIIRGSRDRGLALRMGTGVARIEVQQQEDGTLKPVSTSGSVYGSNGWVLAHEAMKVGFKMATPLEATQRAILTNAERSELNDATNSEIAETRQGIFGPLMHAKLMKVLKAVLVEEGFAPSQANTYAALEKLFVLPQAEFESLLGLIYEKDILKEANRVRFTQLKEKLRSLLAP